MTKSRTIQGISRQQLIDSLADLYGYSEQDFTELHVSQIYSLLTDEQIKELAAYLAA